MTTCIPVDYWYITWLTVARGLTVVGLSQPPKAEINDHG